MPLPRITALQSPLWVICVITGVISFFAACHRKEPVNSGPLVQRAYVWQRQWTPAVNAGVKQASAKLQGLVLFGSEVTWPQGKAKPVRATIDWPCVQSLRTGCSLALRVSPHAPPFDEVAAQAIIAEAQHLLFTAQSQGVRCSELQLDFDCPERRLASYRPLVQQMREAILPTKLVITTLPVWLDEPDFPALIAAADSYILQAHSVRPAKAGDPVSICDAKRVRRCVALAAALRRPFCVALATYSALVGYDAQGRSLGYVFEGPQPDWPPGTRTVLSETDADAMAALVHEWQTERPAAMQGVLWYRLPISTDQHNWPWPTFAAVLEGRAPRHRLIAETQGNSPIDLLLINEGEAAEPMNASLVARWNGAGPQDGEALPGWKLERSEDSATFTPLHAMTSLAPGSRRSIGWLRFEQASPLQVEVVR